MARLLLVLFLLFPAAASAQPLFTDITGMFTRSAFAIVNSADQPVMSGAWSDVGLGPGCSRIYFNTGAWFDWRTGWYEEFCLRGNIIYLKGWSIPGPDAVTPGVFLAAYQNGQPGQPIAMQSATEPYAFSGEVELHAEGQPILRYTDYHLWTPTADGWSHEEVFQWRTLFPGSGRAFHSFSLHKPGGWMYAAAHRTFIAIDGTVTHEAPIRTVKVWQW